MRDLRAAIRNQPPAEHEYDWAPIHMPGSVQSYGVLLVADAQSRRVLFVSDNTIEMFGVAPADIFDKSYLQLIDREDERRFLKERVTAETILFPNPVRMTIKNREYDAVFHAQGGVHMIEIEPSGDGDRSYADMSTRATAELFDPPSVDELYQRAVRIIREVTGFDRVMLYRFDERYNGQVIAEAGREGIGSFLGLFFPSSDIGARSRDLYLQNFTRYIPDIGGRTFSLSGVFPGGGHADSGHAVDMSHTNLRSVVPCHVTYLRNIGVQASMSFSINVDGRLWGLFACHHYTPRPVSYDQRVVCEQAAMMFIYRLAVMSSTAARLAQRQKGLATLSGHVAVGAELHRRIAAAARDMRVRGDATTVQSMVQRAIGAIQTETAMLLPATPPLALEHNFQGDGVLTDAQQLLLDLVEADSAAIVRHGAVWRIGNAPPTMAIYAIASMFGRELPDLRTGDLHVYATDSLGTLVPAARDIKDRAAGVMAAALSLSTHSYLLWFRREQIVHATWAGNPAADAISAGSEGFNPRASFDAWKQDIRDLSRPWQIEDVEVADELSSLLREFDRSDDFAATEPSAERRRAEAPWHSMTSAPREVGSSATLARSVERAQPAAPVPPRHVIRIGQR